ncbi:MAG TPA: hypothetical protein VGI33_09310 [Paenibacillus sp.]
MSGKFLQIWPLKLAERTARLRKSGSGRLCLQMYTAKCNSIHLGTTAIGATFRSPSASQNTYLSIAQKTGVSQQPVAWLLGHPLLRIRFHHHL